MARAFAIVSWSVAPTAVPSTMIGPLKPNDFSFVKSPAKSTLPVPNWIITSSPRGSGFAVAEWRRAHFTFEKVRAGAILCDDAGHVGADDLERRDRILSRVIDHVARVEEDAEVRMIDLPHPPDELTGRVVEPVMMLDHNLHAALLAECRSVGQHLGDVDILIFAPHPQIDRVGLPEGVRIRDLLPHGGDGLGQRHGGGNRQVRDRRGQPARGELLLQGGD